jgi:hypothetical protein
MNGNRRRIRDPFLTLAGVFKLMFGILKKKVLSECGQREALP